ncbi:MAG: methyltransferase [Bacteroidota bacterium]
MIRDVLLGFFLVIFISCQPQATESLGDDEILTDSLDRTQPIEQNTLDNFQNLVKDYENPERNEWQHPELILRTLEPLDNKVIADIGAGTGYFTFRIAREGAEVIAIDIDQQFLDYIDDRKLELSDVIDYDMVRTVLSKEDDPLLVEESVDGVLLVNTYHFINNRVDYMKKVKAGLRDSGKVVIVDYKRGDLPLGPDDEFKVSAEKVSEELKKAGFINLELDIKSLEYQYLITGTK